MPTQVVNVMVVEDAPEYQGAVALALSLEPYLKSVHVAPSGEEALSRFTKDFPDLVLLDFQLPGMDGLETARRMKERRPDVKIALVTAHTLTALERVANDASVDEVIPKAKLSQARLQLLIRR